MWILFREVSGEMLESCGIGDVVSRGDLVNGVGNAILHHRCWKLDRGLAIQGRDDQSVNDLARSGF